MRRCLTFAIGCFVSCCSFAEDSLLSLESQTDETIRSACHGFFIEDLPESVSWLREHLIPDSQLCRVVSSLPADISPKSVIGPKGYQSEAHEFVLYSEQRMALDMACRYEWMCINTRSRFNHSATPISQSDYDSVRVHCRGEYGCIDAFFSSWPRSLPVDTSNAGLSLSSLLNEKADVPENRSGAPRNEFVESIRAISAQNSVASDPTNAVSDRSKAQISATDAPASKSALSLQALMGDKPKTVTTDSGLGDIYGAREQRDIAAIVSQIGRVEGDVKQLCQCSFTKNSCYRAPMAAVQGDIERIDRERRGSCASWSFDANDGTYRSVVSANEALRELRQLLRDISDKDRRAENSIAKAEKEHEQRLAAQRAAQESSGGFQWGKLAALGAGALAGGITNLDAGTQMDIMASIVSDSMAGSEGVTNLQGTLNAHQAAQNSKAQSGSRGGQNNSASIDESYTFECPATKKSHTVDIRADSRACAEAQKTFAKVMGCNLVDEMSQAQSQYNKACASEMYK